MKLFYAFVFILALNTSYANHDTLTFYEYAAGFAELEKGDRVHAWGSETIQYLGTITWVSPSGKELQIRIVTDYRRITEANGFKDQSILALVKTNNHLIRMYDLVSRQNLPTGIKDNKLVFASKAGESLSPLPEKFAERFCVEGMNCFEEAVLATE